MSPSNNTGKYMQKHGPDSFLDLFKLAMKLKWQVQVDYYKTHNSGPIYYLIFLVPFLFVRDNNVFRCEILSTIDSSSLDKFTDR